MLTTVIPSVCEESFPMVLVLTGVELHHYRKFLPGFFVLRQLPHVVGYHYFLGNRFCATRAFVTVST